MYVVLVKPRLNESIWVGVMLALVSLACFYLRRACRKNLQGILTAAKLPAILRRVLNKLLRSTEQSPTF